MPKITHRKKRLSSFNPELMDFGNDRTGGCAK